MSSAGASLSLAEKKCLNCSALLQGGYCSACGQKAGGPPLHLHDLAHELAHEFLHFDSKIWQTLRLLLLSPGALTRAHVAGQRVRYVGPVRLFLVASLLLFGLLAMLPGGIIADPHDGADRAAIEAQLAAEKPLEGGAFELGIRRGALRTLQNPEHFKHVGLQAVSKSAFLLVPLFALLTWWLFKKEFPHYVAHLYFSLHFHAFLFLCLAVASALAAAGPLTGRIAMTVFMVAFLVYFFAALRRTFAASWVKTLGRGALVLVGYATLNFVGALAILVGTLLLL